jgi:carbonic anhydrase/acetyltransferase-like protein (isoleucine patch superfamily)
MVIEGAVYALAERRLTTAGENFYIAPGAQVIGSVILGAWASLWFNCVVRADDERIQIGEGSNIQDGAVLHADAGFPTIIGRDVTVGHMALLHSCRIEDESLIGNGAIVLDRAHIGRHCVVAAGALVPPDREIPEGSVVMGTPGRIVRSVTAEDLALIHEAAAHYRARVQRYRAQLKPFSRQTFAGGNG